MKYIPRTAKKKLITDQTSPIERNLNLITAEASNTLKIKLNVIGLIMLMLFPSDKLDDLSFTKQGWMSVQMNVSDDKISN